ncbi:Ig-like domain-containing protein, partial [Marinicella litoralis]
SGTCTAVVQLDGTWSCTLSGPVVDGDDIMATQDDPAGNTSPQTTELGGIDTSAPDVPTVTPLLTNDVTPVISGTAEANSTVTVQVGGATYTTTASPTGVWSIDLDTQAPDSGVLSLDTNGANDVTATATDAAGNTSAPDLTSGELVLDTTAPTAPSIDPVNENTNPVTGLSEPGALITLTGVVCDNDPVFADVNGVWSCDVTSTAPLTPGDVISATATDPAGNESGPGTATVGDSNTQSVAPHINSVANGDVEITGTAIAGSIINVVGITCDNDPISADAAGDWICINPTPTPTTGDVINVTATQGALQPSPPASTTVFDPNVTAPAAPNVDPTDGDPVEGTTIPNGDITVYDDMGNLICSTTADGSGNFSCSPVNPLPADGDVISVIVTDENGNSSSPTQVTVDAAAPDVPTVTPLLTNDVTPVISGTAEANSTVTVQVGGATYTTTASPTGVWSIDLDTQAPDSGVLSLDTNGANDVTATATDAAGNTSAPDLTSGELVLDTTAPTAPSIDPVNENTNPVTGLSEPGALITLTGVVCDNDPVFADVNGVWSCDVTSTAPLTPGDVISATATDPAGNESGPGTATVGDSNTQSVAPHINSVANGDVEITGTAIAGSIINVVGITCDNDPISADAAGDWICINPTPTPTTGDVINVTATQGALQPSPPASTTVFDPNVTAPAAPNVDPTDGDPVEGTTIPNGDITVYDDMGNLICSTTADGSGNFSCSPVNPLPADGDVISVIVTDENGNSSSPTQVTVDQSAPAVPVITAPITNTTINDNSPLIVGTGEVGSLITVTGPDGQTCTDTVDLNGDWSCTLDAPLADGSNTITAVAEDDLGNVSQPDSITIDVIDGQPYELTVNAPAELVTTEMGDTDTFEVSLPLTPTADVTVNFSSSNTDEGTVSPSTVVFNASNWNVPVTITVTGVDDVVYDLDQNYQVIISALSSGDADYDGINPDDINAVNIDDDESPDLTAFITNCVAGVLPTDSMIYRLYISNTGNKDINGATVATVFSDKMSVPSWICQGADCNGLSGTGNLNEIVNLPVGSQITYLFDADVTGALMEFIDVEGSVTMPISETDVNPDDNVAFDSDLIYQFLFKDGFDCALPGTVGSTNKLFESLNK